MMLGFSSIKKVLIDQFLKMIYWNLSSAFSVDSHLTITERVKLYQLAKNKSIILEIGSYTGASGICFGEALINRNTSSKIICIDTWQNNAMTEGTRDTFKAFCDNTQEYSEIITKIRGFSSEVVEDVSAICSKIDLLFIDGDHSYDGVKADWENYKRFLRRGSIVVFHDIGWAAGVNKVINEDVLPMTRSTGSLPNMMWCEIK
jgi:predicted O-methyltransferase YrrM